MNPSRTAIWAAAARAIGAREPDPHVRNRDWLAERLIGPEERAILGDHPLVPALNEPHEAPIGNVSVLAPARILIVRTHFIDDMLEASVRDGVEQIVILGAGFDSRAYRFADLLQRAQVFEVDRPDTQQTKMRRVRETIGAPPANLSYVPIDFRNEGLGDVLGRADYQPDQRTFFIWEGVTMYLPDDAIRTTLGWIRENAPSRSTIVFDYTYQSLIEMGRKVDVDSLPERMRESVFRFRSLTANEPWIFGLPDRGEKEFLSDLGWDLRNIMGVNSNEAVEKYLRRANGSIFGFFPATPQQGYLILQAGLP
jgi:methyltransferase (TIGR00027 family)